MFFIIKKNTIQISVVTIINKHKYTHTGYVSSYFYIISLLQLIIIMLLWEDVTLKPLHLLILGINKEILRKKRIRDVK